MICADAGSANSTNLDGAGVTCHMAAQTKNSMTTAGYQTIDLCGWGRYPKVRSVEILSEDLTSISAKATLCRGMGRSYGDCSLPKDENHLVMGCRLADRLIAFDEQSGVIRAEAGLSLYQLNWIFLKRGWFVPVTPGTQYVTLGGMVAADVHGKNHHVAGCFGNHVREITLQLADGAIVTCSDHHRRDLFRATLGGMGLTGHILEIEFAMERIPTAWIFAESERIHNIDQFLVALRTAAKAWPFTVGWIDCLAVGNRTGRGILMKGRWAERSEAPTQPPEPRRKLSLPWEMPRFVLNRSSIRLFNGIYYAKHPRNKRIRVEHPEAFFYPLDTLEHWNRLYGRRGFTQYQCVVPDAEAHDAIPKLLKIISKSNTATSFLSVIKDCGPEGRGILSFPMKGVSLALDIPIDQRHTQSLIDRLNAIVGSTGGRIYLAKDAMTRRDDFQKMETRLADWRRIREQWDPHNKFSSALASRLLGDVS